MIKMGMPKKIYLQVEDDCDCVDYGTMILKHEVIWCIEKVNEHDVEYTLTPKKKAKSSL